MLRTKPIIDQHLHGCFGVDFNTATTDEVLALLEKLYGLGVGGIFPTLMTDEIPNIQRQISNIKSAAKKQTSKMARILGVHLEGIFLNSKKKGIHDDSLFLMPNVENYKKIEDEIIKIVTLAPELDIDLIKYLRSNNVKVQAGHCVGGDLSKVDGVTHLFNAMGEIHHRNTQTALEAVISDNLYTEIIADGVHLSDDILKLIFKIKPLEKILLVSDSLPITKSDLKVMMFGGKEIFYDGDKATSKDGTLAGSTKLIPDIIKILGEKGMFSPVLIENTYNYHGFTSDKYIEIDDNFNVSSVR